MVGLRRSIVLASADRYLVVILNFATLLITARLLTPAEFGIAVMGLAALGIADIIRDFGGTAYLVQIDEPTPERVQTVFTVTFLLTLPLVLGLLLFAGDIAGFYGQPGLKNYLYVTSLCFLFGPFIAPIYALLRREMRFGRLMIMNTMCSVTSAAVTIVLVLLGFSYMSFAWAGLASATLYLILCMWWGPRFSVYRFSLTEWRDVAAYGVYDSVKNMLYYLWEVLPLLAFGKILGADGVGLYQRAVSISRLTERTVLSGLSSVLLPALSKHARTGGDLKQGYLNGVEHVAVILWPALVVTIFLAHPIVAILLGHQWFAVVPLVQIIATAMFFWMPLSITNSVLIAAGAVRQSFLLALVTIPPAIAVQIFASFFGLHAAAYSLLVTVPFWTLASVATVRAKVPFTLGDLSAAIWRSAGVALLSGLAPASMTLFAGGFDNVSIPEGLLAGLGAVVGWLAGLHLTRHPMLAEVNRVFHALAAQVSRKFDIVRPTRQSEEAGR